MSEFKTIETQEELDKIISDRLARQKETIEAKYADYDELKSKISTLETENAAFQASIEETGESSKAWEQEKADLTAKIAGYETAQLKQKVAIQAGLPIDLADRLTGNDEETLKADAERFSSFIKPKIPTPPLKSVEPNLKEDENKELKSMLKALTHKGE